MKLLLPLLIVVFALLGVLDAGYVSWSRFTNQIPLCTPPFACSTVLESSWSKVGPIPLSVLGVIFYTSFLILGAASLLEFKSVQIKEYRFSLPAVTFLLGILGAGFSLYLIFVMGVVLQAWCLYCVLSAINCIVLFLLSLGFWKHAHQPKIWEKKNRLLMDADRLD